MVTSRSSISTRSFIPAILMLILYSFLGRLQTQLVRTNTHQRAPLVALECCVKMAVRADNIRPGRAMLSLPDIY